MIRKREKKENLLEKRKKENNKKKRPGLTEHHLALFKVDAQGAVEAPQSEQSSTLQYDDNDDDDDGDDDGDDDEDGDDGGDDDDDLNQSIYDVVDDNSIQDSQTL